MHIKESHSGNGVGNAAGKLSPGDSSESCSYFWSVVQAGQEVLEKLLFIGDADTCKNERFMRENNITHVVNATQDPKLGGERNWSAFDTEGHSVLVLLPQN